MMNKQFIIAKNLYGSISEIQSLIRSYEVFFDSSEPKDVLVSNLEAHARAESELEQLEYEAIYQLCTEVAQSILYDLHNDFRVSAETYRNELLYLGQANRNLKNEVETVKEITNKQTELIDELHDELGSRGATMGDLQELQRNLKQKENTIEGLTKHVRDLEIQLELKEKAERLSERKNTKFLQTQIKLQNAAEMQQNAFDEEINVPQKAVENTHRIITMLNAISDEMKLIKSSSVFKDSLLKDIKELVRISTDKETFAGYFPLPVDNLTASRSSSSLIHSERDHISSKSLSCEEPVSLAVEIAEVVGGAKADCKSAHPMKTISKELRHSEQKGIDDIAIKLAETETVLSETLRQSCNDVRSLCYNTVRVVQFCWKQDVPPQVSLLLSALQITPANLSETAKRIWDDTIKDMKDSSMLCTTNLTRQRRNRTSKYYKDGLRLNVKEDSKSKHTGNNDERKRHRNPSILPDPLNFVEGLRRHLSHDAATVPLSQRFSQIWGDATSSETDKDDDTPGFVESTQLQSSAAASRKTMKEIKNGSSFNDTARAV